MPSTITMTRVRSSISSQYDRRMAMLNAPTMECDRVNLRRSVPV